MTVRYFTDSQTLSLAACENILRCAKTSIDQQGRFVFVLAGGSSPQAIYQALGKQTDFADWVFIYGDERFLPATHSDRNAQLFLQCVPALSSRARHLEVLPAANLTPNQNDLEAAAQEYQTRIDQYLPADFCLLGMGEDGHTASLFPANLDNDRQATASTISINNSPKPPLMRHSLSYATLANSRQLILLASGNAKVSALKKLLSSDADLPITELKHRAMSSSVNQSFEVWTDIQL